MAKRTVVEVMGLNSDLKWEEFRAEVENKSAYAEALSSTVLSLYLLEDPERVSIVEGWLIESELAELLLVSFMTTPIDRGNGNGNGYGNGYGDGYGYGNGNGNGYGDGNGYGNGNGNGYGDGNGDGNGDGYGNGNGYGDGYGDGYG
jgi:hypothetical protein